MANLADRSRPTTWADVVGQEKVVGKLRWQAQRGVLAGRAYWISGQSGTGKTTIANLIAAEIADPLAVVEISAPTLTGPDIEARARGLAVYGWGTTGKTGRAIIINEAHAMRRPVIQSLLDILESIPPHAVWIFTTTTEGDSAFEDYDDGPALLSRCLRYDLSRRGLAEVFAARAREIAQREGLDGQPIERYVRLAKEHRNNLRAMLSAVERGDLQE